MLQSGFVSRALSGLRGVCTGHGRAFSTVVAEVEGHYGHLQLNRPEALNALSSKVGVQHLLLRFLQGPAGHHCACYCRWHQNSLKQQSSWPAHQVGGADTLTPTPPSSSSAHTSVNTHMQDCQPQQGVLVEPADSYESNLTMHCWLPQACAASLCQAQAAPLLLGQTYARWPHSRSSR